MDLKLIMTARDVPGDGETSLAMEYALSALSRMMSEAFPGVTFGEVDSEEL